MKSRIILIFALFLTLTGFRSDEKAVKQSDAKTLRSANVDVRPPVIMDGLRDISVKEGQSAEFRVRISSNDVNTKIEWYKDGKEIFVNEYFDITFVGDTAILRLKRALKIHEGRYTMRVINRAGQTTSSAILRVE